ncbi:MAG TPA: hypothetical protein VKR05_02190 [Candidatus Cybelea sp.]|nr:hypothetical protein [Candidatus Cybelea sp.]
MVVRVVLVASLLAGCGGGASAPPLAPSDATLARVRHAGRHAVGLGKVLTAKGQQIFGFDIDRNGNDGVLATSTNVETFDQDAGTITKTFPKRLPAGTSYSADGIAAGDVGLITRYVVPQGKIYAKRFYNVVNPVTKNRFTGKWTPPVKDINVYFFGPNQDTSTTAVFAIELKKQDKPILFSSNVANNTFGKVFKLNPTYFSLGDQPQFAQDSATNQAVIATSPDGGRVGGEAPINVLVDLVTGKETQWNGFNNGAFGAGFVNGLAVDSTSGIAATTTELNAQVEFYNLSNQTGTFTQLPCTGSASQYNSGWGITNDSINGLFLVTDTFYCSGSQGSAIVVYDENGNYVESITGFSFPIGPAGPAINPSKRMGWAIGPHLNQLQQFYY